MGLGVVADEIDVADDVQHARSDDLQPEIGDPGDLGQLEQRSDRGGTDAGVSLFADQELTIPVLIRTTATTARSTPTRMEPTASGVEEPVA